MTSGHPARQRQSGAGAVADEIVCACVDLSLVDMRGLINRQPGMTYDGFLRASRAGSVCTACLLDLEHYFVHLPRTAKARVGEGAGAPAGDRWPPLKQRLYDFVDRLAPAVPVTLRDHVPVLFGPGVEQWLWMANHSLLYEGELMPPPFRVELTLRDASGMVVWRKRRVLEVAEEWRENLSAALAERDAENHGPGPLGIGWLEIVRRATRPGFRGTTRPQIEIVAEKGGCAVHGQSARFIQGSRFTLMCRPAEDRAFLSVLNASSRPIDLALQYPGALGNAARPAPRTTILALPPYGARLHEIALTHDEAAALAGRLFNVVWRGAGVYKTHVVVASRRLDRFSIDHA